MITVNGKDPIAWSMELNVAEANRLDLIQALLILRQEVAGYQAYARNISEAMNRGDGSYHP